MNNKEKLAAYTGEIISRATAEADAVKAETTAEEDKALAEYEAWLSSDSERRRAEGIARVKAREDTRILSERVKNRRRLLEYRESCALEVFSLVKKRVAEYTASAKYADRLCELLSKAAGAIPGSDALRVYLRPEDMKFRDELAACLPKVKLDFVEGSFSLGGLMVVNEEKSRRIDLTFDSSIHELSDRFSEISGFRVED